MRVVALATCLGLLLLATAGVARAWSQLYVSTARFAPDASGASSFNSSLNQNYIQWDNRYGGYPSVGLRYCRTDGTCYAYVWSQSPGVFYDQRSISYGQGWCHAYAQNNYDVFVSACRVSNG